MLYTFPDTILYKHHTPTSWANHLNDIRNHTKRLIYKRKAEAKARAEYTNQFKPKKEPKTYATRINAKGNLVITIYKRKPSYLHIVELKQIQAQYTDRLSEIDTLLKRRKIEIKDNVL